MTLHYLALGAAIVLSTLAAFFSVKGLAIMFPGSFVSVIIMAAALEFAKVITAAWLHRYWHQVSRALRIYLLSAVVLLMLITSMGVFGFLSKAHLEQKMAYETGIVQQIKTQQLKIDQKDSELKEVTLQLSTINDTISKGLELSRSTKDAKSIVGTDRKIKAELTAKKTALENEIALLKTEQLKLNSQRMIQETEIGPIKFIIETVLKQNSNPENVDRGVFWLMLILVLCFDPLAIALVLATNLRYDSHLPSKYSNSKIEIPLTNIAKIR